MGGQGGSEFKVRMVRPRPGIFEAVLITEENKEAVKQWVSRDCGNSYPIFGFGDWIVKKSSGSIEVLHRDDFFAQYESIL